MSTRGAIGRKVGKGFKGVYHHWDSYPSGLGHYLWIIRNKWFKGDTKKMLNFIIDEHPAGWSGLGNYAEKGKKYHEDCYCHGWRSEKKWTTTDKNASDSGVEYAYVFHGDIMEIWTTYCDPKGKFAGQKMIGAFGCGDPKAIWKPCAKINLNGKEPNWKALDKKCG
jgi:hypothetical protein